MLFSFEYQSRFFTGRIMKILKQASKGYLLNGIKCEHIHLGNCRHLYLGRQGLKSDLEVHGRICIPGTTDDKWVHTLDYLPQWCGKS